MSRNYEAVKRRLAQGWNTWNTRSVLSHVCLPQGFAVNLGIKEYAGGQYLKEALIGRIGEDVEVVRPGPRTYDGSYTSLQLCWKGVDITVETAVEENQLYMRITPERLPLYPPALVVEAAMLWNRPGTISRKDDTLQAVFDTGQVRVHTTGDLRDEPNIAVQSPYLAMTLDRPVGISTGQPCSIDRIGEIIHAQRAAYERRVQEFGEDGDVYQAMQVCMAWDTIYEPKKERVVTPVSRLWNIQWGGYVLFCWDTYFAAYMASLDYKDLAYANAVEMTQERTARGFVPNFAADEDRKSEDRSQPPVGSMVVRELYRRYRETWLLEEVYEGLMEWNTWFFENRQIRPGLLAWGSNAFKPAFDSHWEHAGVSDTFGAALESGLDNSPMYDGVPFDQENELMQLADVGLMGLYAMDCRALADIASVLERHEDAALLGRRASAVEDGLHSLWDEETEIFLNRRMDTGEFSHRLSPTNFYALLSQGTSPQAAERAVSRHFYDPGSFWGDWILPSIARSDPAYADQDYWRGRIWAPMNFLVYLGLRRSGLVQAQRDLAERSTRLILKEWKEKGHVHENYCADTGAGCNKRNSDRFYHWGGLLALIALMEAGWLEGLEAPL